MNLDHLACRSRANSERWFPDLHARSTLELQTHYVMGLVGEAGELANLAKKADRYGHPMTPEDAAPELADVFTYLLLIADELGVNLERAWQEKQAVCEQRWGGQR